ncbi:MAG: hypothetical protein RLZ12_1039 [Bacillota bacterium]|jgi:ABC-2 type transport system ATP-binding protein
MGDTEAFIHLSKLHKYYGEKHVIKGIDLAIKRGEVFGFLGPSGAGKTTTVEILEGLRPASSGKVLVLGSDPREQQTLFFKKIGVQFQKTDLPPKLKVREALALFNVLYKNKLNDQAMQDIIEKFTLRPYLNTYFENLSGGTKQKLILALAIAHNPQILFLDEPTTGMDPKSRQDFYDVLFKIKAEGRTIILTTHNMDEANKFCDRIAFFYQGKILDVDTPQNLAAKYGENACLKIISPNAVRGELQALASVLRVEEKEGTFLLYSDNLQAAALEVFQLSQGNNWHITSFGLERGSLEELFISLGTKGGAKSENFKIS